MMESSVSVFGTSRFTGESCRFVNDFVQNWINSTGAGGAN